MKEITLKFETEELFNKYMNYVIVPQTVHQTVGQTQVYLEYDFEKNIGILTSRGNKK